MKIIIIAFLLVRHISFSLNNFNRFRQEMETKVIDLAAAVSDKFTQRCSQEVTQCQIKSYNFCQGTSEQWCNDDFPPFQSCSQRGTSVSRTSAIRFPSDIQVGQMTEEQRQFVCLTAQLEKQFQQFDDQRDQRYTLAYVGSHSGAFRQYPANKEKQEAGDFCIEYDPRQRPWYIAATTGPKNLIIMIDVSGSMKLGKIQAIKEAAINIVQNLANVDHVGVIAFNATAHSLINDKLSTANAQMREKIIEEIQKLEASGTSNYESAFIKGLQILNNTYEVEAEAPCTNAQNIILFLSDGSPRQGALTAEQLISRINEEQRDRNIIVFTYGTGSETNTNYTFLRTLSCAFTGMMFKISDATKLVDITKNYYEYLSIGSYRTTPIWSEPYDDHFGFGPLFTVSMPIYYIGDSLKRIIGVAGLDIPKSKMLSFGLNQTEVQENLIGLSSVCPALNFSECYMDYLREDEAKCDVEINCTETLNECTYDCTQKFNSSQCTSSCGKVDIDCRLDCAKELNSKIYQCSMKCSQDFINCEDFECPNNVYDIPTCNQSQSSEIFNQSISTDESYCCMIGQPFKEAEANNNNDTSIVIPLLASLGGILFFIIIVILVLKRRKVGQFSQQQKKDSINIAQTNHNLIIMQSDSTPHKNKSKNSFNSDFQTNFLPKFKSSPVEIPQCDLSEKSEDNHSQNEGQNK